MLEVRYNVHPTIARKRHPQLVQKKKEKSKLVEECTSAQYYGKSVYKNDLIEYCKHMASLLKNEVEAREIIEQQELSDAFAITRWQIHLERCQKCQGIVKNAIERLSFNCNDDVNNDSSNKKNNVEDDWQTKADYAHPALEFALERLVMRERVARNELYYKAEIDFVNNIEEVYDYEHRVLLVRTLPLEHFLRSYIARWRARKVFRRQQLRSVINRESSVRLQMLSSVNPLIRERYKLFVECLRREECYYRSMIELLWLHSWCAFDMIRIEIFEQVERFVVLFGCNMSNAKVCGRIRPHTAFYTIELLEVHHRETISKEEVDKYYKLVKRQQCDVVECIDEPTQRRLYVEREEHITRCELQQLILVRFCYHSLRELEKNEAYERQVLLSDMYAQQQRVIPHAECEEFITVL